MRVDGRVGMQFSDEDNRGGKAETISDSPLAFLQASPSIQAQIITEGVSLALHHLQRTLPAPSPPPQNTIKIEAIRFQQYKIEEANMGTILMRVRMADFNGLIFTSLRLEDSLYL